MENRRTSEQATRSNAVNRPFFSVGGPSSRFPVFVPYSTTVEVLLLGLMVVLTSAGYFATILRTQLWGFALVGLIQS